MDYISVVAWVSFFIFTLGCAQESVFPIEDQANKNFVFQYCGGQEWGYVKKLSADEKDSSYLAVYLESDIQKNFDAITLNFVLQTKTNVVFSSTPHFQILLDGREVYNQMNHFWILWGSKAIWDKYSKGYSYKKIENTENDWEVRKQKYGGFLGDFALDDPFTVRIEKHPNQEIKNKSVSIKYTEDLNAIYILNKIVVPFGGERSRSALISFHTPAFELNGFRFPEAQYSFQFNKEKLLQMITETRRCASLDEIFRAGRNKNTWMSWWYPQISN